MTHPVSFTERNSDSHFEFQDQLSLYVSERSPGNVVWLDDDTSVRALVNSSRVPKAETVTVEPAKESQGLWS